MAKASTGPTPRAVARGGGEWPARRSNPLDACWVYATCRRTNIEMSQPLRCCVLTLLLLVTPAAQAYASDREELQATKATIEQADDHAKDFAEASKGVLTEAELAQQKLAKEIAADYIDEFEAEEHDPGLGEADPENADEHVQKIYKDVDETFAGKASHLEARAEAIRKMGDRAETDAVAHDPETDAYADANDRALKMGRSMAMPELPTEDVDEDGIPICDADHCGGCLIEQECAQIADCMWNKAHNACHLKTVKLFGQEIDLTHSDHNEV
eukprot:COSAG01_NODE_2210_length_8163_cov_4.921999_5_plen_271_part_00